MQGCLSIFPSVCPSAPSPQRKGQVIIYLAGGVGDTGCVSVTIKFTWSLLRLCDILMFAPRWHSMFHSPPPLILCRFRPIPSDPPENRIIPSKSLGPPCPAINNESSLSTSLYLSLHLLVCPWVDLIGFLSVCRSLCLWVCLSVGVSCSSVLSFRAVIVWFSLLESDISSHVDSLPFLLFFPQRPVHGI